jgi:hypothetical protein
VAVEPAVPVAPAPAKAPKPAPPAPPAPEPAPAPAPTNTRQVMIRTDPMVAEVQVGSGPRVRTPHKFELNPGRYIVYGWSGDKPAEFVIEVDEDPGKVHEFCYMFRRETLFVGTCPPN